MAILEGLDRAALDREYNNREKVSDVADHLAYFSSASEAARSQNPCQLDIAYGNHPRQLMDFFPSGREGKSPCLIFIHGGYWHLLNKDVHSFVMQGFKPHGFHTATINYPLMPDATMADLVESCRAAVQTLWDQADQLAIDRDNIILAGHSAGGHMAFTTAAAMDDNCDYKLKAVFGLSGLYDLEPISRCYLNDTLDLSADDISKYSPITMKAGKIGKSYAMVGGDEGAEYIGHSKQLAASWSKQGTSVEAIVQEGLNHFTIVRQLGDPESELTQRIIAML
jgi:arylformamidase